jgi:plastocyanin
MFRASLGLFAAAAVCGYLAISPPAVLAGGGGGGGGGGCRSQDFADSATNAVAIRDNCLYPVVARVATGESVTWTNQDITTHTVTGVNVSWGSLEAVPYRATYRFESAGVYPYYCAAHPWMAGVIVVGGDDVPASGEGSSVSAAVKEPPAAGDSTPAAVGTPDGGSSGGYFALGSAVAAALGLVAGGAGFVVGRRRA